MTGIVSGLINEFAKKLQTDCFSGALAVYRAAKNARA
jgi:hypothetical protein